jgi:hypothetical protein
VPRGGLAGADHVAERFLKCAVAQQLDQRRAARGHAGSGEARQGLVAESDPQLVVDGENTLRHGRENGLAAGRFHFGALDQDAGLPRHAEQASVQRIELVEVVTAGRNGGFLIRLEQVIFEQAGRETTHAGDAAVHRAREQKRHGER